MIPPALLVLFFCNVYLKEAFSANILIAYDLPSPSHQLWNYALAEGLIEKGHNVTMIGPFSDKGKKSDAYHPILFEGTLEAVTENTDYSIEESFATIDPFSALVLTFNYVYTVCNHSYNTNGFKVLMNYPKDFKFDLIIIDATMGSCLYPFIQRFGYPPVVAVTAFLLPSRLSIAFGNGAYPSYLPFYWSRYTDSMSFLQRVKNYILTHLDSIFRNWYEIKKIGELARQKFGENVESMESLERHISLLLCNLDEAFHFPQPLTPNIIPVGGLHVKPSKPLPKDLQTIMDNAKDGAIFFSLGTNVRSDHLSVQVRKALLKAFGKLKQTVIWKYESKLDDVPKNVIVREWLPQNDILGHPNLKLFISHGGALSTLEAAYHGIPIIGMPFFIDQRITVNFMLEKKLALKIDFHNVTSQDIEDCINEMLTNPVYSRNMNEISKRMRDQPQTPLEKAVFWVEYALRYDGAKFLTPKSRDMSVFVSSSVDVLLFLITGTFLFVYVLYILFKRTVSHLSFKSQKKEKLN